LRLFIAAKIPKPIQDELGEFVDQFLQFPGKVKWVEPNNMHLTLKFLGETDPRILEPLKDSLTKSSTNFGKIDLALSGCGAFPNLRKPRVFWVGIIDDKKRLRPLADQVDSVVAEFGFEREQRPFSPHLTLGRVKDEGRLDLLTDTFGKASFSPQAFTVESIYLIESHLKPTGPVYKELAEFKL
jgi:2'-5' RNA ligase